MAEPTRTCPRCQRVALESSFVRRADATGDVCRVCHAGTQPRPDPTPGKWAPSSVGALSIFVNPLFITSVITIGRARAWLRYAEEREYSPWHAQIRSNALWGIVLTTFQPIAVVVMLTMALAFHPERVEPTPAAEHDERAEILALVESDLPVARLVGVCQLDETGPHPDDRALVEAAMQTDDETTKACGHLVLARLDDVPIVDRFSELPIDVQAAMLEVLEERNDPRHADLRHIHYSTIGPM